MRAESYDVAVVGLGGMGSAALLSLARRGLRVCGIERFAIGHDRGSSHGDTRIIRKAYLEHPDYVPLLHRAYELWEQLNEESGLDLFVQTGLVVSGYPDSPGMRGQAACYRLHALPHEELGAGEVQARYPQLQVPEAWRAFYDPLGGFLRVEQCVRWQVELARRAGAAVCAGEQVRDWRAGPGGVQVETERRRIAAGALVLAAGAWAAPELAGLGVELHLLRKVLFWYRSPHLEECAQGRFPCFLVDTEKGVFYGFPVIDEWGLKVAEHSATRQRVERPEALERELVQGDEDLVAEFLQRFFPRLQPRRSKHAVCMYTMSPDEHFIIDRHPQRDNVVLAAGFSGHGFKFASVVGEILAELAVDGQTRQPIDFLRLARLRGGS